MNETGDEFETAMDRRHLQRSGLDLETGLQPAWVGAFTFHHLQYILDVK